MEEEKFLKALEEAGGEADTKKIRTLTGTSEKPRKIRELARKLEQEGKIIIDNRRANYRPLYVYRLKQ